MKIKGFTLIELVLVVALLGILSVGVATLVINYKSSFIEVSSNKVKSDIDHARGLAMMKQGTTFGVFFDSAADRYTVYEGAVAAPVKDPLTKQDLIETFSKWQGISIIGANYTVEFNKYGAPSVGGGGSVQITDGTNTKTISVTAGTGKVTVQ